MTACRWGYEVPLGAGDGSGGSDASTGGVSTGGSGPGGMGGVLGMGAEGGAPGSGGMVVPECGNGIVEAGEECDPAGIPACNDDCTFGYAHYLSHRFAFDGFGTEVEDAVGGGSGVITQTTLDGSGELVLVATGPPSQQFALLNGGLASENTNATFEVWFTWNGDQSWQRVFDFGNSDKGRGQQGTGSNYLFLTPRSLDETRGVRATFSLNQIPQEIYVEGSSPIQLGVETHVAVVANDALDLLQLYVNGAFEAEASWPESLSSLEDVNCWLGLSQFEWDPEFDGSINELRIYDVALTAEQIALSHEFGPDI